MKQSCVAVRVPSTGCQLFISVYVGYMTWDTQPKVYLPPIDKQRSKKRSRLFVVVICLLLTLFLVVAGFLVYKAYCLYFLPGKVASGVHKQVTANLQDLREFAVGVSERFRQMFKFSPTVFVMDEVVAEGFSNIAHLVLHEAQFSQEREFSHSFLGSTKRLHISGEFRSRAGINLASGCRIDITSQGIGIKLPPPEVLSVELKNIRILQDSDGLWNRIRPSERQEHINEMVAKANETAKSLHAGEDLEQRVSQLFLEALGSITASDMSISIVFTNGGSDTGKK